MGWLALSTALHVPGARSDPVLLQLMNGLQSRGGGAAVAAGQLKNLLVGRSLSRQEKVTLLMTAGGPRRC